MEARELAEKLNGRAYGDSFDDVLEDGEVYCVGLVFSIEDLK